MFHGIVTAVQVLSGLLIIVVILLQQTKGAGFSSVFGGGGGDSIFGSTAGNVLTRTTVVLAAVFAISSVSLGLMGRGRVGKSVLDIPTAAVTEPAAPVATPQPIVPEDLAVPAPVGD